MFQGEPGKFPFYVEQKTLIRWEIDKLFFFPFHVKEYLTDGKVEMMTYEEQGIFIRLLCHQWLEYGIPADLEKIRKILSLTPQKFKKVWQIISTCFEKKTRKNSVTIRGKEDKMPLLVNKTLEKHRTEVIVRRLNEKKSSSSGGTARAKKIKNKKELEQKDEEKKQSNPNLKTKNIDFDVPQHNDSTSEAAPQQCGSDASQTQTQNQSQINKSLIPEPNNTQHSKPASSSLSSGVRPLKKIFLEVSKESVKAIKKIVEKRAAACSSVQVTDSSPVVKDLFIALLRVPEMRYEPQRTLAYMIQARNKKGKKSDVGMMIKLLASPEHSPSDESIDITKDILNRWQIQDSKNGPGSELVNSLADGMKCDG